MWYSATSGSMTRRRTGFRGNVQDPCVRLAPPEKIRDHQREPAVAASRVQLGQAAFQEVY